MFCSEGKQQGGQKGGAVAGSPIEDEESKKSERKRQRERQRRFDLANAFDELATLLAQVDPEQEMDSPGRRRRRKGSMDMEAESSEGTGTTRLDLIGRSIDYIRRLSDENEELKKIVGHSRDPGGEDKVK